MRALLSTIPHKCGTETNTFTKEYVTLANLIRYAARPYARRHSKPVRVEVFYDPEKIYGTPSRILVVSP